MKLKLYLASLMLVILAGLVPVAAMAEEKKDAAPAAGAVTAPPATAPAAAPADPASLLMPQHRQPQHRRHHPMSNRF